MSETRFGRSDIAEIICIPTDSRKDPEIIRDAGRTPDELIDRARFMSRNTYHREIRAVVNGLAVAWFSGRYFLDNPDDLPPPGRLP